MENFNDRSAYAERLARVMAYIHDHLDEELDFARLAEVACLSPYHWHRIYLALYGESAAATVRRLRLHRAAGDLANCATPIAEIATRAGYDSVAAVHRAFKAVYGAPPAQFRREGGPFGARPAGEETMHDLKILETPRRRLAVAPHIGPYIEIGRAFDALYGVLGARNLIRPTQEMIAVYCDDPSAVAPAALRSAAGVSVDSDFPIAPPLEEFIIAGGPCAVLRHTGPYAQLKSAYDWLFGVWLPSSGRVPADQPVYEVYINNPQTAAQADLVTDIHLPLR